MESLGKEGKNDITNTSVCKKKQKIKKKKKSKQTNKQTKKKSQSQDSQKYIGIPYQRCCKLRTGRHTSELLCLTIKNKLTGSGPSLHSPHTQHNELSYRSLGYRRSTPSPILSSLRGHILGTYTWGFAPCVCVWL